MSYVNFLKKQHLDMFEKKRDEHKRLAAAAYEEYRKIAEHDENSDVMVKISGYSAQYVKLDDAIQNAIIERAERGI